MASVFRRGKPGPPAGSSAFNLFVVYNPSSGGVGVNLPITIEQFSGVSLTTVASLFASNSELITVRSFAQAPNPSLSACALMNFDAADAVPVITLKGSVDGAATTWTPEPDLLENGATDPVFVVEVESNGVATLRFGDNVNGKTPDTGTSFVASYRMGNGTAGNVGADSLVYLAAADARIQSCRNPLARHGRHRPGNQRSDPPPGSTGFSHPGTRRHHGGLREPGGIESAGGQGRGLSAVDGELVHDVYRGGTGGRRQSEPGVTTNS